MNSYHGESVYQVSLLEDQPQVIYRHKHHLQVFTGWGCLISASNSYHGESVYQVSLLEDQP